MKLALAGVSHHRAPIELRERVAVDDVAAEVLCESLARDCEVVVLSTCNRTELYLASLTERPLERRAKDALVDLAGEGYGDFEPVVYGLEDESAALHLFRVAAGLDSMVPGEGEILGQVRQAFERGVTGPLLGKLFRTALHVGRRARVETLIGESPASVPAAAAALARQVFGELEERAVLLVGAGKTSESTARSLRSRGARVVAVANRTHDHAAALATAFGARPVTLADVPRELETVDVVVSSTSAPGLLLLADEVGEALRARKGRPLLFVDLAVPRDVDPAVAAIDGCFVYDIDDLESVVATTLAGRRSEAVRAERLVAREAERFAVWQASLAVVPAITSLRARAEAIRSAELARVEGRLGRLPAGERAILETVTAQIVNKLLHLPTVRMKEAAVTPDGVIYAEVVRHLFGLEDETRSPGGRDES